MVPTTYKIYIARLFLRFDQYLNMYLVRIRAYNIIMAVMRNHTLFRIYTAVFPPGCNK